MGKYSNWSKEEDQILREVIRTTKSKKWIKTSLKLQENSYIRTPSECRQRFINYLAPNINKSEITQQQLELLYEKYEQVGPKWSIIQQFVKCKTQCKIKNVFYGNIKNLLKTVFKYFTFKTAPFVNTISTQTLQIIYDGALQFDGMKQVKEGIRAMNYRNNKIALIKHIHANWKRYLMLINTVRKEILFQNTLQFQYTAEHDIKIKKYIKNEMQDNLEDQSQRSNDKDNENNLKYQYHSESAMISDGQEEKSIKVQEHLKVQQEQKMELIKNTKKKEIFPFKDYTIMDSYIDNKMDFLPNYYPYPYIYMPQSF